MGKNGKTAEEKKPGMLERARKMVSGNGHDEGGQEQMVNVNGRMVPVSEVPKASDLDRANEFLGKAKAGGRMAPAVQLRALQLVATPDRDGLKSVTFLTDRQAYYISKNLAMNKIVTDQDEGLMPGDVWAKEFMSLRRSVDALTLIALMRQAGVDTEADAITRMGRL
jgi:hypothetical protein